MLLKSTILLLSLISFTLKAQNEEKKYELERVTRQNNHIRQILTYEYNLAKKDSILVEHNFYDSTGNLVQRRQYDKAKRLQYKATLTYDNRGLETQEAGYDGAGNLFQIFVYEYDKDGHRTDYNQLTATGKVLTHQKSVFNSKGQRIKLFTKMDDGQFHLTGTFSYGDNGLQSTSKMYSPYGGDIGSISQYEYDANGNLIADYQINNKEKKLYYTKQYNSQQQLIETNFYQRNQSFSDGKFNTSAADETIKFEYDSNGNIIEETTWNKTTLVKKIRYYFKTKAS